MQKRYSQEAKEAIVRRMLPPTSVTISELCKETGVARSTIYKWKNDYRSKGITVPSDKSKSVNWSAKNKLAVVIETASLNAVELNEYCRHKGLYPDQVTQWKQSALLGYQHSDNNKKEQNRHSQEDKQKIKSLESEIRRKDKALAETAALLVLSKKFEAIWGGNEED